MLLTASLVAVALSSAIAGSNDSASAPIDVSASQTEKKICRKEVGTGSIMPKKVCRTKAQWQELTARGKADMDRTRDMDRSKSLVEESRN